MRLLKLNKAKKSFWLKEREKIKLCSCKLTSVEQEIKETSRKYSHQEFEIWKIFFFRYIFHRHGKTLLLHLRPILRCRTVHKSDTAKKLEDTRRRVAISKLIFFFFCRSFSCLRFSRFFLHRRFHENSLEKLSKSEHQ